MDRFQRHQGHSHFHPGSTILNFSLRKLTLCTNAYSESNVPCNIMNLAESPGPVCMLYPVKICYHLSREARSTMHESRKALKNHRSKAHHNYYRITVPREISIYSTYSLALLITKQIKECSKIPFPKVMLHPALQIKLWGGEDPGIKRGNRILPKTLLNHTKFFDNSKKSQKISLLPLNLRLKYLHNRLNKRIDYKTKNKKLPTSHFISNSNTSSYNMPHKLSYTHHLSSSKVTLHSAPQIKLWGEGDLKDSRRKSITKTSNRNLTLSFCYFRMSQRATNSSASQRYKEKLLALENNPDIEMFVTQKRSSTSQTTTN